MALAIAAVTAWTYWPALDNGFVNFDDDLYVTGNGYVRSGLTPDGFRWAFSLDHQDPARELRTYWHPLTWLSLMTDAELHGPLDARGFHLTNVLLHSVNAALVFLMLAAGTGAMGRSIAVALLFGLHPINVEAVAWVTERKTVLSSTFGLIAVGLYVALARRRRGCALLLAALLLTLSLLAKPALVTLPLLLLLLDFWPLGLLGARDARAVTPARLVLEKGILLSIGLASFALTLWSLGPQPASSRTGAALGLRVANALASIKAYLGLAFWPDCLAVFYPLPEAVSPVSVVGGVVALALGTTVAITATGRMPALLVGWSWFLVALAPCLGLVQSGLWPSHADRFAYVPFIGLMMAVVWTIEGTTRGLRSRRLLLAALSVIGLAALAARTRVQIDTWRDSVALFENARRISPESAVVRNNLAGSYRERGRIDEAIAQCEEALRLDPRHRGSRTALAQIYVEQGRFEEAREQLASLEASDRSALSALEMGNLFLRQGRLAEAIASYRLAVARNPRHAGAYANLGEALRRNGALIEAQAHLEQALSLDPFLTLPLRPLAEIYAAAGRLADAAALYRRVVDSNPELAESRSRLGLLLGQLGRLPEAIRELAAAVHLAPADSQARNNLGTAYLLVGQPQTAVPQLIESVRLDPGNAQAHHNLALAYGRLGRGEEAERHRRIADRLSAGSHE